MIRLAGQPEQFGLLEHVRAVPARDGEGLAAGEILNVLADWAPTAEARQAILADGPDRLFFAARLAIIEAINSRTNFFVNPSRDGICRRQINSCM